MKLTCAIIMTLALSGCSESVTHREKIPFSSGQVDLTITSVGGALGEERYELKFDNNGKVQTFFQGANFAEFRVGERDGKLLIHMCRGQIDRAQPIGIGPTEKLRVFRLDLDWNCLDKSHEA